MNYSDYEKIKEKELKIADLIVQQLVRGIARDSEKHPEAHRDGDDVIVVWEKGPEDWPLMIDGLFQIPDDYMTEMVTSHILRVIWTDKSTWY